MHYWSDGLSCWSPFNVWWQHGISIIGRNRNLANQRTSNRKATELYATKRLVERQRWRGLREINAKTGFDSNLHIRKEAQSRLERNVQRCLQRNAETFAVCLLLFQPDIFVCFFLLHHVLLKILSVCLFFFILVYFCRRKIKTTCREQQKEMEEHLAEYAQHYPLKDFPSQWCRWRALKQAVSKSSRNMIICSLRKILHFI